MCFFYIFFIPIIFLGFEWDVKRSLQVTHIVSWSSVSGFYRHHVEETVIAGS